MAFPSVMLTAAVPAQAEWNGNDIMFIQERCSQAQISVSKMPGRSRTENMPETSHWISSPGAHPALHSPPPLCPHRGTAHHALQTHTTPCKQVSTHATYPHPKTPTTHTSPSHITQTHINTRRSGSTHMYHVFTDTQTPRGIHRCTWSLPIPMQTTTPHIYFQVGAEQLGCRRSYRC